MKTKQMALCALFAALTCAGVFVKLPIPGTPMSFTLQTFFIFLAGLLLKPKYAFISQAVYAAVGLTGLPVFMNGGGVSYVLQPTFGFIIGFCVAATLTSLFVRPRMLSLLSEPRGKAALWLKIIGGALLCIAVMYAIGVAYMSLILNQYMGGSVSLSTIIIAYNGAFIPLDMLKFAAAIPLGLAVLKRLPRSVS